MLLSSLLVPFGGQLSSPGRRPVGPDGVTHVRPLLGGLGLRSPGVAHKSINFTGDLAADFGAPYYVNTNASSWGALNNLSAFYVSYNTTDLFLGFSEVISGNSLMVFVGNGVDAGGIGTYNLSGLGTWGGRALSFSSSFTDLAAVYFGTTNGNLSGFGAYQVLTPPSQSNSTPAVRAITSLSLFDGANDAAEIALPLSTIFPVSTSAWGNVTVAAFVVGNAGAWVGTGLPYAQTGRYDAGSSEGTFLVSDTFRLPIDAVPYAPARPVSVAIIFNDHQPLYQVAGAADYNLPWTWAHATAEYIEQAIIIHQDPTVHITYELSGSLLYQLWNISHDPGYNDSFQEGAWIPFSELNTTQNQSELSTLEGDWFSIPPYVFAFPEPAAALYQQLDTLWRGGTPLTAAQYEDAKVLWFLYEVSTDLVEGRLGASWKSSTLWALHNQTSFSNADLRTVIAASRAIIGQVIPAFQADRLGNPLGSDNTELFTSPFYHPLTPLLLTRAISGPAGTLSKGSYSSDVQVQMNLSRDQFDQLFGTYPHGLYASELAVSQAMVEPIARSGAQWSLTDEWTLQQSGVTAEAYGNSGWTVPSLEALYTPYVVAGANGTSTTMLFRDAPLSNNWAFNYGNLPTATAISDIVDYLKGINGTIPVGDHPDTLVTLALDGENWQFMSPFADDGVPFLEGLYAALRANSTAFTTVTPTQWLDQARTEGILLPHLGFLATGTWNQASGQVAPFQSNISLTQWSGYNTQNWMWVDLDRVRAKVVSVMDANGLVQLQNQSTYQRNLTAATPEGNITRAWYGIYNAEGSDWFFQMAPWTISGANTLPFNLTFQGDLAYALSELNLSYGPPPPPPARPVTVLFHVVPASCGAVTFNGTSWSDGSQGSFLPGHFTASVGPCTGSLFVDWSWTGGLTASSSSSMSLSVNLSGNGTLQGNFVALPPPPPPVFVVGIGIEPTVCGPITYNGSLVGNGAQVKAVAGNETAVARACTGYTFQVWRSTGGVSPKGNGSVALVSIQGNGTLIANYTALPPPGGNSTGSGGGASSGGSGGTGAGPKAPTPWYAQPDLLLGVGAALALVVALLALTVRHRRRSPPGPSEDEGQSPEAPEPGPAMASDTAESGPGP